MPQGRKVGVLIGGNGCSLHDDCLTCPGPDRCVWPLGNNRERQEKVITTWGSYFKERKDGYITDVH